MLGKQCCHAVRTSRRSHCTLSLSWNSCPSPFSSFLLSDPFTPPPSPSSSSSSSSVDGQLWTMGRDHCGQLGVRSEDEVDPEEEPPRATKPVRVTRLPADAVVVDASCGAAHTMAVTADGRLFGFGYNEWGSVGIGIDDEDSVRSSAVQAQQTCNNIPYLILLINIPFLFGVGFFSSFSSFSFSKNACACACCMCTRKGVRT